MIRTNCKRCGEQLVQPTYWYEENVVVQESAAEQTTQSR